MRSWLVIPAAGAVAAAIAGALVREPIAALAAAAAGAAGAHAVRALSDDSPAIVVGALLAAILAATMLIDTGAAPWLALAAAAWTIAELARTAPRRQSLVALLPATVATILSPACAALVVLAGIRVYRSHRSRAWIAVPIAGVLAVVVAAIAAARDALWFAPAHPTHPRESIYALADALGPLAATAAFAGIVLAARPRIANVALCACVAGALLVDLRAGAPAPLTLGLAAICAGVAIGRFAGTIRLPAGQAIVAATCGALLVLPPAWAAISR